MQDDSLEPDEIRRLIRELGEAGGARIASSVEVARLRNFFGRRVLRQYPDAYIQRKYDQHVVERQEWRLFVAFNAQQHVLITGFQPPDGDRYVERQGGFWVHER